MADGKPTLPLRLVAMRLPETVDWIRKPSRSSFSSEPPQNILHLTPGMVSEISLELENTDSQPITWSLEMTGNFPVTWYYPEPTIDDSTEISEESESSLQINQSQIDGTIQPHSRLYPSIRLSIPDDFFEAQAAVLYQESIELNYDSEIFLFAQRNGRRLAVNAY